MIQFTLTMLDTSGIQPYIFGSNRLQENIGASEIVYRATTMWAFQALDGEKLRHNVNIQDRATGEWNLLDDSQAIEAGETLDAEVVYAGGGNTMVIFRHLAQARAFTQNLTRQVLRDAPGLTLVVRHVEFGWNEHKLPGVREELLKALAAHKQARLPSTPLLSLGVTVACESTGLAAERTTAGEIEIERQRITLKLSPEEDPRLISRETVAKLGWRDFAQKRLEKHLGPPHVRRDFKFPSDIDKLGRVMGEESYVAVVHADGNRMGEHVKDVGEEGIVWDDITQGNRAYVRKLRAFSQSVNAAAMHALQSTVRRLDAAIDWDEKRKQWLVSETVPLAEDKWFPFRPLVFGGDDVTFLCNGPLGLALAAAYLEAFEKETQDSEYVPDDMYACAGVAMVKMHYPFARAYTLSEQLSGNAKRFVRQGSQDCSALDWHFAVSGLSGSLGAIRRREYERNGRKLYLRPVRLYAAEDDQSGRYWEDGLERVLSTFQEGEQWIKRRSKVKGLLERLRNGPLATETYCDNFELPDLPALLPGATDYRRNGWSGNRCVYFDAIELMDHYVPLPTLEVFT